MRPRTLDLAIAKRLIPVRDRLVDKFNEGHWEELGLLTEATDIINGHDRLLRSLRWHDDDYEGNVLTVLRTIVERAPNTLQIIEHYLDDKFPGESHYISAKPAERKITFAPHVFEVPEGYVELDLAAVMMPFAKEFDSVHTAIKQACESHRLRCVRADDIWVESVIMQDIFSLIFRAQVVIVDFTGKNPNVMYETGIAHTLGKHVVPITQSLADVPSNMGHHRVAPYLANKEGFAALRTMLKEKLKQFAIPDPPPKPTPEFDDEIPF